MEKEEDMEKYVSEHAGRRDLLSGGDNRFHEYAYGASEYSESEIEEELPPMKKIGSRSPREWSPVRRLNTIHNPRVSSEMKKLLRHGSA